MEETIEEAIEREVKLLLEDVRGLEARVSSQREAIQKLAARVRELELR